MQVEAQAPALVGLPRKSRGGPSAEDRAWRAALLAGAGLDQAPVPVFHGGQRLGWVFSDPWWMPGRGVWWRREMPGERRRPTLDLAGFPTYESVRKAQRQGKRFPFQFQKTATGTTTTGNWYDLWPVGGAPGAGAYGGTAHTAKPHDDTEAGAIWHDGNKSAETKHLSFFWGGLTDSSGAAGNSFTTIILYDRVLTYEAGTITNANVVMTNTLPAARYLGTAGTATGDGLKPMVCVESLTGATAANLTQFQYTDQDGNTLQSMPTTPTVATITAAATPTTTIGARIIAPCTAAATLVWGPFLPLAVGDCGVQLIDNRTFSANNTGTITWVLARPLAILPLPIAHDPTMMDTIIGVASGERILDGACLSMIAWGPAALPFTLTGGGEVVWS